MVLDVVGHQPDDQGQSQTLVHIVHKAQLCETDIIGLMGEHKKGENIQKERNVLHF